MKYDVENKMFLDEEKAAFIERHFCAFLDAMEIQDHEVAFKESLKVGVLSLDMKKCMIEEIFSKY